MALTVLLALVLVLVRAGGDGDDDDVVTGSSTTTTTEDPSTTTSTSTTASTTSSSSSTSTTAPPTSTTASVSTTTAPSTTTTTGPPPTVAPARCTGTGTGDPAPVARTFYDAWTIDDRACAQRIASAEAVEDLFVFDGAGADWSFESCAEDEELPETDCFFRYEGGSATFTLRHGAIAGWRIESVTFTAD